MTTGLAAPPAPGSQLPLVASRRVLIATPWYPTATDPGAGAFVRDNVAALREAGHEVNVLHVSPVAVGAGARRARYPATRRGALALGVFRAAVALSAEVRRTKPDLIHAHVTLPVGAAAALVGRAIGLPVVLTEHTGPFDTLIGGSRMRAALARWALREPSAVVAVSQALAVQMRAYVSTSPTVIPNPVDLRAFTVTPAPRSERVLFVGRLAPEKRLPDLLAAFALLRQRRPGATLRLVGDGPARPTAVPDGVTLVGQLNRVGVARELAACDLLVLASEIETFGVALVEALASGRPVVATRCGGPEEIVDEEVGALAPVGDPPALSAALEATLTRTFDPAALRARATARYGSAAVASWLDELYARC